MSPAWQSHLLVKDGIAALTSGRPDKAVDHLQASLGLQKANTDAYAYLARALIVLGEAEAAQQTIALARERFPQMFSDADVFGLYPALDLDTPDPLSVARLHDEDSVILKSHQLFEAGVDALETKNHGTAVNHLLSSLEQNPWNFHAYYYLAAAYAGSNDLGRAQHVLEQAIAQNPYGFGRASRFGEYQGFELDPGTTIAYYRALAKSYPDLVGLQSPCVRTGTSSAVLDSESEAGLRSRYADALASWRNSETPLPEKAGAGEGEYLHDGSLLLVSPRYIKCNPDWVEYDATFHYEGTAKRSFSDFDVHYADAFHSENDQLIQSRTEQDLNAGLADLRAHIEAFNPDIVFFDGNFEGGRGGIAWSHWAEMKKTYGFKLVIMVGDIYQPKPNNPAYWSQAADVIVALNDHEYLDAARQNCEVFVWPGVTIDQTIMDDLTVTARDLGVSFAGSRKAYRDMWCAHLVEAEVPFHLKFTGQSRENSVERDDYIRLLKRSKIGFNSGLVSSRDHHHNFRIFETMTAGAVLLQQDFPLLRQYFVPYVHYAPFENVHEMVSTAQFLLKNDDIRAVITAEAGAWYQLHYGGPAFWRAVLERLGLTP